MKKLCVFYDRKQLWIGKPITWIVCNSCQNKLRSGKMKMEDLSCPRRA